MKYYIVSPERWTDKMQKTTVVSLAQIPHRPPEDVARTFVSAASRFVSTLFRAGNEVLRCWYLVVSIAIALACHTANAQSVVGAQISGVVSDPTGAVIPGAQIKATQIESGQARTTVSTSNGDYALPNLPVGPYRLE